MTEALLPTEDLDTILTMLDAAASLGDEQTTLELCEAARTVAPDDVDVLLTNAAVLIDLDQIDDARSALERCVAHHGDIPVVWQRLGELCLDTGDSERAIEAFRQLQRLEGATADNELALAWAYVIDLQLEKARRHLAAADSADEAGELADITELAAQLATIDDPAALESEAGWWLCGRGALDQGLPLLRSSLGRRDDPETRHRLGVALLTSGEFDEATTALSLATAAEPATVEWMDDLGTAQLLNGDLDGADATFDRLLAAVPSDHAGLVGSGRVALRRGDPERAVEMAEAAIGEDPESAEAWTLRATAQLALDRPAQARVSAEHAIAFAADDRVAWATAAEAAGAAGATRIAARYRGRSTLRLSGSLGITEGGGPVGAEIDDELHELDRLVVADPLIREIYRHRSGIALELGLPERAMGYLRAAIERGVIIASADSICDEGILLLMAGQADAARRQFERVLSDEPDHHRALAGWRQAQQRADYEVDEVDEVDEAVEKRDKIVEIVEIADEAGEQAPAEPEPPDVAEPWAPSHAVPPPGMPAFGAPGATMVIAQLEPGLAVQVLERAKRWARVRFENGWECWVDAFLLVPEEDGWAPTHRVPDAGLTAFATPFADAPVAARLEPGLAVEVITQADAWAHVRFENGWSCWTDGATLEVLR